MMNRVIALFRKVNKMYQTCKSNSPISNKKRPKKVFIAYKNQRNKEDGKYKIIFFFQHRYFSRMTEHMCAKVLRILPELCSRRVFRLRNCSNTEKMA